jgi:L-seryl-tRNA(Ser) seleniumtransferase
LEIFVNQDYDATLKMYDARAQVITDAVQKFGVTALPREFNPQALGNVTPHYSWHIDSSKLKITGPEVMQKLADTRPIGIGSMGANSSGMHGRDPLATPAPPRRNGRFSDPSTFGFAVWQIKEGEDKIIAERLVEIFSEAPKAS